MIISLENLREGIVFWNSTRWGADFVNGEYVQSYSDRENGITDEWWEKTIVRLGGWGAFRSRTPNARAIAAATGRSLLRAIDCQYRRLCERSAGEPSIADLNWEDLAPLFGLALEIKSQSPMFASKLCHFVFPMAFIVIDNWATGIMDYELCWREMNEEWSLFEDKDVARRMLQEAIKSEEPIHSLYPFETKIMELCLIAHYWKNRASGDARGPEVDIVRVGAEGGDLALVGEPTGSGWRFSVRTNESLLLDEDDIPSVLQRIEERVWVHSWPAAVALLDQHPWAALLPLNVHPEFREAVWREVNLRLGGLDEGNGEYRIDRWRKACRTAADSN
jgi:hypothetical protein